MTQPLSDPVPAAAPNPPRKNKGPLSDVRYRREPVGGCITWLGPIDGDGFPVTRHEGKTLRPHRVTWALRYRIELEPWMALFALCENKRCLNPEHHAPGALRRVLRRTRTHRRAANEVRQAIIRCAQPGGAGGFWWNPSHPLTCSAQAAAAVATEHGVNVLVVLATFGHLALAANRAKSAEPLGAGP